MRINFCIILISLLLLFSGCSNTKFLAKDQLLYTGRQKVEIINSHNVQKTSSVKNYVESVTNHKVNNALFGRRVLPPFGLWVYNYYKPVENKKIRNWLNKTLSSNPVLLSEVNPELRSTKIENELFDKGYFGTRAWSVIDTSPKNPKKARVSYFVDLAPPNYFREVILDTIENRIDSLIRDDKFMTIIKPGEQFNLDKLKTSRIELSRRIQDDGYFYFNPEFIDLKADTTVAGDSINLLVGQKSELVVSAISRYIINNIVVQNSQGTDTTRTGRDSVLYDGIVVVSPGDILKPEVITNSVYFRKGDTYSYSAYQNTITRLNNLGVFKYVNITYKQDKTDTLSYRLDVLVDLIMADNINLELEADLATKSSGYFGPLFLPGISHGNTFGGAERLKLGLTGGFEWQWGQKSETQLGTYSYQFGINTGLTVPRIVIPFIHERKTTMLLQRTAVNLELSILNRTAYYKMFSAKTNLNYQWSKNQNIQHSLYPLYINSVNLLETTPDFDSVVNDNIYIKKSFEEQFIFGAKYEFNFNNTITVRPNNFFFQGGISTSGNLVDLFASLGQTPEERPYSFLNNIYSQYLKLTTDFRYYRNGYNKSLVFRLYAGLGIPYLNSLALPYVEQFFSGGAYSVRAFTARYLGPGSYHEDNSGYIDQSGDIKLETNMEFRFDMSKMLKGALFVDVGNIWLVNDDPNRPGARFHLNTFYDELAVGTGFGLRFDFTFFVLRTDFGMPLRNPYKTDNKNWLFGSDKIFTDGLFHLAIGYPF